MPQLPLTVKSSSKKFFASPMPAIRAVAVTPAKRLPETIFFWASTSLEIDRMAGRERPNERSISTPSGMT